MRRLLGGILVVLGALFVGLGLLAKPYLYDRLAVVPLDQRSQTVSEGPSMNVLRAHVVDGAAAIDKLTGVKVVSTRQVLGIPGAVESKGVADQDAFWQTTVKSQAEVDGQLADLTYSDAGVSFDRRTGEATNCCGDFVSTGDLTDPASQKPMTFKGLYFKFPFDVQQQDYLWWDSDVERADPIKFQKVDDIEGLRVYVFQQKIGPEPISSLEAPASLFSPGATGDVTATEMYSNTRTLWVEPVTGVVIDGNEEIRKEYQAEGYDAVAKTVGSIGYNADTVSKNVDEWGSKASMLSFVDNWLTLVGLVVGLILLGLGGFLLLSGGGARRA
jgi:hypothetical protein